MRRPDLAAQIARWKRDRMAFRAEAILLEDGRPFGDAMEPWQRDDFAALDSGQYRHAYLERPRGHSKTADIATEAVAELLLGPRDQRLFCCAADEEQARLLFDDVAAKLNRNPLLAPAVKVTQRDIIVRATGSRLRVLNSDAPSAYGLRPDWIAVDEIAEWSKRALWDSLWSATGKRPRCRVLVISTAGWDRTSIAWEVREIALTESDWYSSSRGQCASWVRPEWIEQQRRTLPPHVFARLHKARWVDGVGAFLTADEVNAIFRGMPAASGPGAIGLDLGVAKDRSVASIVERVGDLLVVRALHTWDPKAYGGRVPLQQVEEDVAALAKSRGLPVHVDFWQAALMKERLEARGVLVREVKFTADQRRLLFGVLLDLIRTGRLLSAPHDELKRELLGLEVQQTATGWRVDHRPGRHDDHVVAVALAAQAVANVTEIPAGAWMRAYDSNGDQIAGHGRQRFVSAFDQVEQNAREIVHRPWSVGIGRHDLHWDW